MELLIDTNVILDLIFQRKGYETIKNIFSILKGNAYISANTVTDLFYIIHRTTHSKKETYKLLSTIFELVDVLPLTNEDIQFAFKKEWTDFEDCVQYAVARSNHIDKIVTNNVKDFQNTDIDVITPEDFEQFLLCQG